MVFINYQEMARDVASMATRMKRHDIVCSVSPSGYVPAAILAQVWHCSLAVTAEDGIRILPSGEPVSVDSNKNASLLILDDSMHNEEQMRLALTVCERYPVQVSSAVLYAADNAPYHSDVPAIIHRKICGPLVCEWNIWENPKVLSMSACDIDGVLCPDKPINEPYEPDEYKYWLSNAPCKYQPIFPVRLIVTSRLEYYRDITEQWLHKNGIKFQALEMAKYDSALERRNAGNHAQDKASDALKHNCSMHIESDDRQARVIGQYLPTLCTDTMTFYDGAEKT